MLQNHAGGARLFAWIVLAVGVLFSLIAWMYTVSEVRRGAHAAFDAATRSMSGELRARIDGYNNVLYGMRGLIESAGTVDRVTFSRYVGHLRLDLHLPDVESLSYSAYVLHGHREAFEARVRRENATVDAAAPGFAITPAGTRADYLVLLYREPSHAAGDVRGADLFADPARRPALDRARSTRSPTADLHRTSPDGAATDRDALTLLLAVRRSGSVTDGAGPPHGALAGMLGITFNVRKLVERVLGDLALRDMHLVITDRGYLGVPARAGADATAVFASAQSVQGGGRNVFEQQRTIEIGQREWLLQFSAPRERFATPMATVLPGLVLGGGLVISLLLFGLTRSVATSWQRATDLAADMTRDLRTSEAKLTETQRMTQELIEALPNPIFFMAPDGRYLGVNKAWEAYFGMPRSAIIGRTVFDLHSNDRDAAERFDAMDQALWRRPGTQVHETAMSTRDGIRHDAIYYKATYTRGDGSVAGLIGTIIDITDRKRAEKRQAAEQAVTRVLAEAKTLAEAVPRIIRTICETMDWQCGARWSWDREAGLLRCSECWSIDSAPVRDFITAALGRGIPPEPSAGGLARQIFAGGKPLWIADIARQRGFRRADSAARAGLRSAFGFPLLLGTEVLGVMEFFSRDARVPDEMLLGAAESIGSQIGQYIVRKQAEEAVTFVATHDALTDLPNRVMFNERLSHAIVQAKRHGRRLAVLFIDLDRFKVFNDTLGHEAGDALLREVAKRLSANLRTGDTIARFGGDEFVVLAEEVSDPVYIGGLARRLNAALAEGIVVRGQEYHVTASIGASTYPDDTEDSQTLLKNADIAMYRAKDQGRNGFQFYSTQMNVHSVERLALEASLRRALERDELILHYQPQIDVRSGKIAGVEALLRWRHPDLGLVPPGKFIPLAEESGLIVPIGEWVLQAVCSAQRMWQRLGLAPLRVAINLSPRQFVHGDVIRNLQDAVTRSPGPLWRLELEITETMVMHNPERAIEIINSVKEMGIQVAMDDFGTGYSSLAYLKRFPIDGLKIDRSFIQDIPADRGDAAITQAIIGMAHNLQLRVVAEGVETREQFEFLRDHGCDELQGYYFSHPLDEAQTTVLLQERHS